MRAIERVDDRTKNRVPVTRKANGMPVVGIVGMEEVPAPSLQRTFGIAARLYAQIADLQSGALRTEFENSKHASYVLTALRKIARKEGVELLSSKSADEKIRWFWIDRQG